MSSYVTQNGSFINCGYTLSVKQKIVFDKWTRNRLQIIVHDDDNYTLRLLWRQWSPSHCVNHGTSTSNRFHVTYSNLVVVQWPSLECTMMVVSSVQYQYDHCCACVCANVCVHCKHVETKQRWSTIQYHKMPQAKSNVWMKTMGSIKVYWSVTFYRESDHHIYLYYRWKRDWPSNK